jgi:histone H3
MNKAQKPTNKKKKSRFFELYILKLLKNVAETSGATTNTKQQLNSILCFICKIISDTAYDLTIFAGKKTISEKEVLNSLKLILPENLCKTAIIKGQNYVNTFNTADESVTKGMSRKTKASSCFPPSIIEKFLRNFGYNKVLVTSNTPIFLTGAIEYIASEMLENASQQAKDKKHVRITVRDLELGVRNDTEFNSFFNNNNLYFLGGGVLPYIHPSLLNKKPRRRLLTKDSNVDEKKKHRFRPGTVSLREIKKLQKNSDNLTFARHPFEKMVRQIIDKYSETPLKISKDVFVTLQYFIEQQLIHILQQANFAAIHANRVKLLPIDINFILSIKYNTNPYKDPNYQSSVLELDSQFVQIPSLSNNTLEYIDEEDEDVEDEDVEDEDVENEDVENEDVENEDEDVENEDESV